METYLCEDVLGIIFGHLPYDLKNVFILNKYCYKVFQSFKKNYCVGNYHLTDIQHKMVNQMVEHTSDNYEEKDRSLVIQANISVGKTCACLTFALNKYAGSVVIMLPLSVMSQWHNEIIKMYGSSMNDRIIILHENYTTNGIIQKCRRNNYNPVSIGRKVVIVSSLTKVPIEKMMAHSVVLMDEVHTRYNTVHHYKFVGVTASKAIMWTNNVGCDYVIYEEEEKLPELKTNHVVCTYASNVGIFLEDIMARSKGPFLVIGDKFYKPYLGTNYVDYDRKPATLLKINTLKENEVAFLEVGNNCTGINLVAISVVIFIYPTDHMNATVIQAIGRVRRVTSKNKEITLYNLHQCQEDMIMYKTYISENEVNKFCDEKKLKLLKHPREKYYMRRVVTELLKYTKIEELDKVDDIYYALLIRLRVNDFTILIDEFNKRLGIRWNLLKSIFRRS